MSWKDRLLHFGMLMAADTLADLAGIAREITSQPDRPAVDPVAGANQARGGYRRMTPAKGKAGRARSRASHGGGLLQRG